MALPGVGNSLIEGLAHTPTHWSGFAKSVKGGYAVLAQGLQAADTDRLALD